MGETVEVGKKVKARVLDVVKADGIVDLTLRPELFAPAQSKKKTAESKVPHFPIHLRSRSRVRVVMSSKTWS